MHTFIDEWNEPYMYIGVYSTHIDCVGRKFPLPFRPLSQERLQDFGYGVDALLPPEAKFFFENLTTKCCILKYI